MYQIIPKNLPRGDVFSVRPPGSGETGRGFFQISAPFRPFETSHDNNRRRTRFSTSRTVPGTSVRGCCIRNTVLRMCNTALVPVCAILLYVQYRGIAILLYCTYH